MDSRRRLTAHLPHRLVRRARHLQAGLARQKLHKVNAVVPGTLTNVTRTSDVIIGLLLLMLAQRPAAAQAARVAGGARAARVRHRHPLPPFPARPASRIPRCVAIVLLAVLLYRHEDFYAVGDPRTRRDRAAGLRRILVVAGLRDRPRLPRGRAALRQLLVPSAAAGRAVRARRRLRARAVGIRRARRPVPLADQRARRCSRSSSPSTCSCARRSRGPGSPAADATRIRELLDRYGDRDSLGYFALRDDKSVIWSPSGKSGVCYRVVSGVMLAVRRPDRRPGGVAGRHRRVPHRGGAARVAARGDGVQRARRRGVVPGRRPDRSGARRRGDRQRRGVQPRPGARCATSGRWSTGSPRTATSPRSAGSATSRAQELDRVIREADSWRGTHVERGFSMALGRLGGPRRRETASW